MDDFSKERGREEGARFSPVEKERSLSPQIAAAPRATGGGVPEPASYYTRGYYGYGGRDEISEYFSIVRRRWKVIFLFVAAALGVAAALSWVARPVYRATSKLIFESRPQAAERLNLIGVPVPYNSRLGTQVELISGRETAKRASEKLKGKYGLVLSPEEIQASLRAGVIDDTDMVKVEVYGDDRHRVQKIANGVAQAFVEWTEERMKKGGQDTAEYLSRQLDLAKAELLSAENALREFKESKGVISLSEETEARLGRIAKLEADAATTYADLRAVSKRLGRARRQLAEQNAKLSEGTFIRDNALIQDLRTKLVNLEEQLTEARARYTDKYPKAISDLEKQIEDARLRLNSEIEAIINGSAGELSSQQAALNELSRLEGEEISLRARQRALNGWIDAEKEMLSGTPADEVELARLSRDATTAAKIYTSLLERNQEAKISQVMEVGNVQIGEAAILPILPIKPNKPLNLAFGLICGLLVGLAAAFLLEYMDDTVRDIAEASQIVQAPLLGIIPRYSQKGELVSLARPRSPMTEAYRTLRSNVVFTGAGQKGSSVLVSSPGAGEGKSSTAANLAVTMANTGKRVILVDTDLRLPVMHKLFGIKEGLGLTDLIRGKCQPEQVLYSTKVKNLKVLPCGTVPNNPADLIDSPRMTEIAKDLKARADIVLFDSPPLVLVTDALLLSTMCDNVLFVCGFGETSGQDMERARQLLEQAHASISGVVVNKLEASRCGRDYGSYHNRSTKFMKKAHKRLARARKSLPAKSEGQGSGMVGSRKR